MRRFFLWLFDDARTPWGFRVGIIVALLVVITLGLLQAAVWALGPFRITSGHMIGALALAGGLFLFVGLRTIRNKLQ